MASPEDVAFDKTVMEQARYIYLGIAPTSGIYKATSGHSNFEPWPMYKLLGFTTAQEEAGTVYFLALQVSDGTPVGIDRNADRLANRLGPPIGHPALAMATKAVVNDKHAPDTEFIMIRVLASKGKYTVEGMVKGDENDVSAHVIEKDTYIGVTLAGSSRGPGSAIDARPKQPSPTRPAMSNAEISNMNTIKAKEAGISGSSF